MPIEGDPRELWKQGKSLDDISRNPDGSYNGARAMSAVSGLEQAEIEWIWRRMKALIEHGYSKEDAKRMVADEGKAHPWEKR